MLYNVGMNGSAQAPSFRKPNPLEALFNRALGFLVGLGVGPAYMHLLRCADAKQDTFTRRR
jgi:hypothetical protein